MKTYLLQAPRDFVDAGIPKGYMIQVISSRSGTQPMSQRWYRHSGMPALARGLRVGPLPGMLGN